MIPSLVNLVPSCSLCLSSCCCCQSPPTYFMPLPLVSSSVFSLQIPKRSGIQGFALRFSSVFLFLRFSSFKLSPRSQCPSYAAGSARYSSQGRCTQNAKVHLQTLKKEGRFNATLGCWKIRNCLKKYILEHYQNCHKNPTRIYPPYPLSVASSLQGSGASRSFDADKAEFAHAAKCDSKW